MTPDPNGAVQWFPNSAEHSYPAVRQTASVDRKPCRRCGHPEYVHGIGTGLAGGHFVCPGDWISKSKED